MRRKHFLELRRLGITTRSLCAALVVFSLLLWTAREGAAQSYPQRPVRLIVPAPAGGPTDVPGRLIADGLSGLLGQRFVVENRAGAGGVLAGEFVARSEPNGYTLLYANTSVLAVNPALQRKMPYDPATAFAPIGFVSNSPQLLVANPKLPYRSVQELVAWAKSNPGKLNFATAGVGTLPHLTYELFRMETGIDALNVPYAGGAPALTAVISGQADVLFDLVRTRVRSGELRALAITGASRDPELPDIPTLAESGYPAVTSTSGTGIVAPAGIHAEIVARLNSKLNELIERPETQAKMKSFGLVPRSGPPEEFGAWAAQERQRWTRVVKESGAKAD
jgi:tripartite-type tricarboxylate transporter receptor subunit TctC